MWRALVALPAVCLGCAAPLEPAPEDVDALARYVFRRFDDPRALAGGAETLGRWMAREGLEDAPRRGWTVTALSEADVAGLPHPDGPLDGVFGVAATWRSPFSLDAHGEVQLEPDQTFLDPATYVRYERAIEAGEPGSFADGDGAVHTANDIEKQGAFGIRIPFRSGRTYAWVPLESGGVALIARGGLLETACSEDGDNCIHQSFGLDAYFLGDGATLRFSAAWNDVRTEVDALLTEDAKVAMAVDGLLVAFENTDEHLSGP